MNKQEMQALLNEWHKQQKEHTITREEYADLLECMERDHPKLVKKYFGVRMDNRTLREWGLTLIDNESLEKSHADWWFPEYAKRHFPDYVSYECVGVSQEGVIMVDGSKTDSSDYKILPTNELIEIKDCPTLFKATYKVQNIKSYIKHNSHVLTLHKNISQECVFYTLLSPEQMEKIVDFCIPTRRYEMGNKLCYQFYFEDTNIDSMMKKRKLSEEALPFEAIGTKCVVDEFRGYC